MTQQESFWKKQFVVMCFKYIFDSKQAIAFAMSMQLVYLNSIKLTLVKLQPTILDFAYSPKMLMGLLTYQIDFLKPQYSHADHSQTMIDFEYQALSLSCHFIHFSSNYLSFHVFLFLFWPTHQNFLDLVSQSILCESHSNLYLLLRQQDPMGEHMNYVPITNFLHFY